MRHRFSEISKIVIINMTKKNYFLHVISNFYSTSIFKSTGSLGFQGRAKRSKQALEKMDKLFNK